MSGRNTPLGAEQPGNDSGHFELAPPTFAIPRFSRRMPAGLSPGHLQPPQALDPTLLAWAIGFHQMISQGMIFRIWIGEGIIPGGFVALSDPIIARLMRQMFREVMRTSGAGAPATGDAPTGTVAAAIDTDPSVSIPCDGVVQFGVTSSDINELLHANGPVVNLQSTARFHGERSRGLEVSFQSNLPPGDPQHDRVAGTLNANAGITYVLPLGRDLKLTFDFARVNFAGGAGAPTTTSAGAGGAAANFEHRYLLGRGLRLNVSASASAAGHGGSTAGFDGSLGGSAAISSREIELPGDARLTLRPIGAEVNTSVSAGSAGTTASANGNLTTGASLRFVGVPITVDFRASAGMNLQSNQAEQMNWRMSLGLTVRY